MWFFLLPLISTLRQTDGAARIFRPPFVAAGIHTHVSRAAHSTRDLNSGCSNRLSYCDRGVHSPLNSIDIGTSSTRSYQVLSRPKHQCSVGNWWIQLVFVTNQKWKRLNIYRCFLSNQAQKCYFRLYYDEVTKLIKKVFFAALVFKRQVPINFFLIEIEILNCSSWNRTPGNCVTRISSKNTFPGKRPKKAKKVGHLKLQSEAKIRKIILTNVWLSW